MSRSRKKPYVGYGYGKAIKIWKRSSNRTIRRTDIDENISKVYKKITDVWDSPRDGKCVLWKDPKASRK